MTKYLERTNADKPSFGDFVTLEMKRFGVPNEYFIHDVMTEPFQSNFWRTVPINATDRDEHQHDTCEWVVAVSTQGLNFRERHIFAVRLCDILPMVGDKWGWRESPLRIRVERAETALKNLVDACHEADIDGDLSDKIDGKLMSAAWDIVYPLNIFYAHSPKETK